MFTGIVEALAEVIDMAATPDGARLVVAHPLAGELTVGESVAVNGTCLTVVDLVSGQVSFDVVNESLSRTNLGDVTVGGFVNIERAMSASGRFDGHIVQGHVDGVVVVRTVEEDGDGARMWFDVDDLLARYIVEKGSVTLDGVSLTVATVDEAGFSVALIPHTLSVTTLGSRSIGDRLNLEVDILAKYIERLMPSGERTP